MNLKQAKTIIKLLKKRIKNILISLLLKFKTEDSIIIFSVARGGSTWLMEILSEIPNTCVNWEPLHQNKGVIPKELNWGSIPYIPKDDNNKTYKRLINNVLSFKVHTEWSKRELKKLTLKQLFNCKIVITKFVRANLLLPYIVTNFDLKIKPILLIRHPIDVCLSQIKAFDKDFSYSKNIPNCINNERFAENMDLLEKLETKIEFRIANWCLNNCLLFQDIEALKKVTIVFYSDLLMNPEKETLKVFKSLNIVSDKDSKKIISSFNFRKPSKTDFDKNLILEPIDQLNKNFNLLTKQEKDKIQNIFDHFNFKLYDAYSPYPKKNYLETV